VYRDIILNKLNLGSKKLNIDLSNQIEQFSAKIKETDALRAIHLILEHRKKLAQNSSPILILESLLMATRPNQ
jgi:hypothetical protein